MEQWRDDGFYTVAEIAEIFKVNANTVRKWLHAGEVAAENWIRLPGGHIRIREEAIWKLMNESN